MAILPPMNGEHGERRDLRTVGRSEDGESLELHDLDGNIYGLKITDHLRSLVNQPTQPSLRSVSDETESQISIKEIQARLRAGESMESISRTGHVSMEKIERYSQPILQERSYIISLAQKCEIKKSKVTLLEAITEKLAPRGVEMKSCEWNTYRNDDGTWQVLLEYPTRDGKGEAQWRYESFKRRIESDDDGARWILDEEPLRSESVVRPLRGEETPPRLISIRSTPSPVEAEIPSIASIQRLTESSDHQLSEDLDSDELRPVYESQEESQEENQEESDELVLDIEGSALDERSSIPRDARRDGVTRKVSIPSWDDIMFGTKKENPRND